MEYKVFYCDYSLKHWIDLMLKGRIVIQLFQRFFVWEKDDVIELIKSFNDNSFIPPVMIGAYNENGKIDDIYLLNNKEELKKIYDKAIIYRNRIAHNTKSSINNLPDFAELRNSDYKYTNPFARFAIMLLVDMIFIDVFKQYEKTRDNG